MHSIRRAAHRDARTYDFFGRPRPQRAASAVDYENALEHRVTESEATFPTEDFRRFHDATERHSFAGPQKSSTFSGSDEPFSIPAKITSVQDRTDEIEADTGSQEQSVEHAHVEKGRVSKLLKRFTRPDDALDGDDGGRKVHLTLASMLKVTFGSPMSLLLLFVPPGIVVSYTNQNPVLVFVLNFFAILPSVAIISFAVDELSTYVGDIVGGLLTMAFGNVAQLISSILLLRTGQVAVLRSSLLGSILQNLLLMTGLAFLCGGINRAEQYFNPRVAQIMGMFLLLAVLSLMIPTVSQLWAHSSPAGVAAQSRGTAVVIMVSYILWLFFQLKTNRYLFDEVGEKAPAKKFSRKSKGEVKRALAFIAGSGAATTGGAINTKVLHQVVEEDEEEDPPCLSKVFAVACLVIFTVLLALNTQYATDAVQGIMMSHKISDMFMGVVVLPLLSNDPSIVISAMKDKMDRCLAMTLDRCMQTALMVVPLVVLIAWGMGQDNMTLDFDGFSVATLFAAVIIVVYVVQEGKSNWLVGALLIKVFIIIGLSSFYIKDEVNDDGSLLVP